MKNNVTAMPKTTLERLAIKLPSLLARSAENKKEWVDINVELCISFAQARAQFKETEEFGQWCEENDLGEDVIDNGSRAAAIAMGKEPMALAKCLEATERTSLRHIYEEEFGRFSGKKAFSNSKKQKLKSKSKFKAKELKSEDDEEDEESDDEESESEGSGESDEVIWYRGVENRAAEAWAGASRKGPDKYRNNGDWSIYKKSIDSKLIQMARDAAEAWTKLADYLEGLKK
jgi:hypothetical protein